MRVTEWVSESLSFSIDFTDATLVSDDTYRRLKWYDPDDSDDHDDHENPDSPNDLDDPNDPDDPDPDVKFRTNASGAVVPRWVQMSAHHFRSVKTLATLSRMEVVLPLSEMVFMITFKTRIGKV